MTLNWKKWLHWLISPFAIGIFITAFAVKLNFDYNIVASQKLVELEGQGLSGMMLIAHHKSVDKRLQVRGPRKVSPNLALLAVDEKAVATIGRWPWPREIIGQAVEEATKYGAKVLAFDMVFAEPSHNLSKDIYEGISATTRLSPEIKSAFEAQAEARDSDKQFSKSIAKSASHIVAGSFFSQEVENPYWPPETEFCRDLIFKGTPTSKIWDKEEVLISVQDPFQPYMPALLQQYFTLDLQNAEDEKRKSLGIAKDANQAYQIEEAITTHLFNYCDSILDDNAEQLQAIWNEQVLAQENPKTFKFPTYKAWLEDYRAKSYTNGITDANAWTTNTPQISEGNKHTGFFNAKLDSDGTIRLARLMIRTGNNYFPSIGLKAFLVANNYNANPKIDFDPATHSKLVTDFEITDNETGDVVFKIPTDGRAQLTINYAGPQKMFPHVSFADLLSSSPDVEYEQRTFDQKSQSWQVATHKAKKAQFFKDKIFIVGATAVGIYDLRVTPFEENYPGAETHLNVIDNLLQRNFFKTFKDEPIYMPFVLLGIGIILSIVLSFWGALYGVVTTTSLLIGMILIDKYYLFDRGIVTTIVWPLLLVIVLYISLTFYRYLTEERGKKELRQTFQKYVSPAIVEEILAHPANIQLGGKKVHVTVFFSDVRGFTTISEKLDPQALSDLLNSYLTPMTEIVFKNRGTLDKYMGDAVMAFFGAPIQFNDHAKFACRCALESLAKLKELQALYESKGLPSIDIGIGLNTGDVSVGNMGSETVRSYTVMGDAVNLASRLEGINKEYGTRIIISEFTYAEVKDSFVCREVDWVRVKGKVLPVKIYELIAENKASTAIQDMLVHFQEGYAKYHAKQWQAAMTSFSKCLDLVPDDEVSKLYMERCQEFLDAPPPEDWDGVFIMKTK